MQMIEGYLNVFGGATSFNAIWDMANVTSQEKIILMYLGSKLKFEDVTLAHLVSIKTIVEKTCLSETEVRRTVNNLVNSGYVTQNCAYNGLETVSYFGLSSKLFCEYELTLKNKAKSQVAK